MGIAIFETKNSLFYNNTISSSKVITVRCPSNIKISHNTIESSDNYRGIHNYISDNTIIEYNTIINCGTGIYLNIQSYYITITSNTFKNNEVGILFGYASQVTITYNNLQSNSQHYRIHITRLF